MAHPGLGSQWKHPASSGLSDPELGATPCRRNVGGGEHADHCVSPAQPLMKALVPLVPDEDAVVQIPIEEDAMAVLDQPPMDLIGQHEVLAREAHEDPGHRPSRRSPPDR